MTKRLTFRCINWKCLLCVSMMVFISNTSNAAKIDTLSIYSQSMEKDIKCVIIIPDGYDVNDEIKYSVVYLLHGYSGDYGDWINKAPGIAQMADIYNMIIVCPDGNKSSWYFDSPEDPDMLYETHITKEVITFVDKRYNTIKNESGRAISGISMGGHGAMFLALRHPELFGAAGSMSGGVDLTPFPGNWDISDRLGSYKDKRELWEQHSVVNMLHLAKSETVFIIDCGTDDFFLKVNRKLHQKMVYLNIFHNYIESPGGHDWHYWQQACGFQILFFHQYFVKQKQ